MALIDVSELLVDADFVDAMSVITRATTVDALGQSSFTETTLVTVGSVQPAAAKTVQKLPEAMRVENLSSFWFKGQIIASGPGQYSSVLVFKNIRYQLKNVADWGNFGAGYTEGICVAEPPSGTAT